MWVLETADESGAERICFRLMPGAIKTVGRAPRADFILDRALVSRLHCRLSASEPEVEVLDLKSTNGTFVNGQRVDRGVLKPGDLLTLGRVELRVSRAGPRDDQR